MTAEVKIQFANLASVNKQLLFSIDLSSKSPNAFNLFAQQQLPSITTLSTTITITPANQQQSASSNGGVLSTNGVIGMSIGLTALVVAIAIGSIVSRRVYSKQHSEQQLMAATPDPRLAFEWNMNAFIFIIIILFLLLLLLLLLLAWFCARCCK